MRRRRDTAAGRASVADVAERRRPRPAPAQLRSAIRSALRDGALRSACTLGECTRCCSASCGSRSASRGLARRRSPCCLRGAATGTARRDRLRRSRGRRGLEDAGRLEFLDRPRWSGRRRNGVALLAVAEEQRRRRQMTLIMRGTPSLCGWIRSVTSRENSSGAPMRGAAQAVIDVAAVSSRVERLQVIADRDALPQLLELRARPAGRAGSAGRPARSECSFDFSVSRFDSMRISSSAAEAQVLRFVDDQQRQPPGQRADRPGNCARSRSSSGLLAAGRVEAEVEHHRLEQLARHRASCSRCARPTSGGRGSRSTVCSSVVLPEPISPVITMKPAWPSMP